MFISGNSLRDDDSMGMFDYINFKCDCPVCGAEIEGFQSKDGPSDLVTLEYWEVDRFYSECPKCLAWIDFIREGKKPYAPINDYKQIVIEPASSLSSPKKP